MEKTHFWYSRQFAEHLKNSDLNNWNNMAIIDGRRFHYNIANRKDQHGTNWPDTVYLGFGRWTRFLPSDQFAVDISKEAVATPAQERTAYYESRRLEICEARTQ